MDCSLQCVAVNLGVVGVDCPRSDFTMDPRQKIVFPTQPRRLLPPIYICTYQVWQRSFSLLDDGVDTHGSSTAALHLQSKTRYMLMGDSGSCDDREQKRRHCGSTFAVLAEKSVAAKLVQSEVALSQKTKSKNFDRIQDHETNCAFLGRKIHFLFCCSSLCKTFCKSTDFGQPPSNTEFIRCTHFPAENGNTTSSKCSFNS
tara:strand:+ start:59 stop:661 length:603 start_codon:yes stop_codon:yes gene_type:complete